MIQRSAHLHLGDLIPIKKIPLVWGAYTTGFGPDRDSKGRRQMSLVSVPVLFWKRQAVSKNAGSAKKLPAMPFKNLRYDRFLITAYYLPVLSSHHHSIFSAVSIAATERGHYFHPLPLHLQCLCIVVRNRSDLNSVPDTGSSF